MRMHLGPARPNQVYERLGLELTGEAEQRRRAFLAANPADKHGGHRYVFADSRLDPAAVRERARRYQEYCDVASEDVR